MEENHALQAEAGNMLDSVMAALPRIQILVGVTERKAISSLSYADWLQQFKDVVFRGRGPARRFGDQEDPGCVDVEEEEQG